MAYWNYKTKSIVYFKPKKSKEYPDWQEEDCGCCVGIEWGGEYPRECKRCGGSGRVFRHIKSKVTVLYPGGPFTGH